MEEPEQIVCSICGVKSIGFHFVEVASGEKKSQTLCDSCFEASGPQVMKDFIAALKEGRCRFCAAPAATTSALNAMLGREEEDFLCLACANEYHPSLLQHLEQFESESEGKSASEQMRLVREIAEKVEAHMKTWVSQRLN